MIKEHKNIETILENLDTKRYPIPEHWPYKDARELFRNPLVTDPATIEVTFRCLWIAAVLLDSSAQLTKHGTNAYILTSFDEPLDQVGIA